MALDFIELTQAEESLLGAQRAGLTEFGAAPPPPVPVPPTITAINPALGTQLKLNQAWEADFPLAPANGVIDRVILYVIYTNSGASEVVYDGAGFTAAFNGGSTLTPLMGGGFHVKILRNAGWLGSPKIFVHMSTSLGGVL